jgi:hypothetical protein
VVTGSGDGSLAVRGEMIGLLAVRGDGLLAVRGDGLLAVRGDGLLAVRGDGLLAVRGDGLLAVRGDGLLPDTGGDGLLAVRGDGLLAVRGDGSLAVRGDGSLAVRGEERLSAGIGGDGSSPVRGEERLSAGIGGDGFLSDGVVSLLADRVGDRSSAPTPRWILAFHAAIPPAISASNRDPPTAEMAAFHLDMGRFITKTMIKPTLDSKTNTIRNKTVKAKPVSVCKRCCRFTLLGIFIYLGFTFLFFVARGLLHSVSLERSRLLCCTPVHKTATASTRSSKGCWLMPQFSEVYKCG